MTLVPPSPLKINPMCFSGLPVLDPLNAGSTGVFILAEI